MGILFKEQLHLKEPIPNTPKFLTYSTYYKSSSTNRMKFSFAILVIACAVAAANAAPQEKEGTAKSETAAERKPIGKLTEKLEDALKAAKGCVAEAFDASDLAEAQIKAGECLTAAKDNGAEALNAAQETLKLKTKEFLAAANENIANKVDEA